MIWGGFIGLGTLFALFSGVAFSSLTGNFIAAAGAIILGAILFNKIQTVWR